MKRIVSILLITFIGVLILNNFLAAILYSKTKRESNNVPSHKSLLEDTIQLKDTVNIKADTVIISNKYNSLDRIDNVKDHEIHDATWYRTHGTRVHREYPTAAYNKVPKGTKLLVTNLKTGDTCVVEVTDRMSNRAKNNIDLSHSAFGKIGKHTSGRIKVRVQKLQ